MMLLLCCEKNERDSSSCKIMFLFIIGGKYSEIHTCQEEGTWGFITIMNKLHRVVSQHSKPWLQLGDSMFTRELARIKSY
jgi:hypothetical protein